MIVPRKATSALLATVVAVSLTAFTSDVPAQPHRAVAGSGMLGYIESGDGLAALRRNLAAVTTVGIDGVNISASGATVSAPDGEAHDLLVATHRGGKRAELLVGNFSETIGDFDPASAHRLFVSAAHRRAVIAALVTDAHNGWDGIHLDFESLHGSDRSGLTRFTTELRTALPRRKSLSMAVMASTTRRGYRDTGYDLPALSRRLTRVVLMGYDQHGPTWTKAGPIGGLPWVKQALTAMLASVPRSKAVLGVAGYGYTWPTHGTGTQLSDAGSRRSAASTPAWDATQAEWHARLTGGGTLWWSDAKSLRVRRALARNLGLRGVAVWSLGLSDRV